MRRINKIKGLKSFLCQRLKLVPMIIISLHMADLPAIIRGLLINRLPIKESQNGAFVFLAETLS